MILSTVLPVNFNRLPPHNKFNYKFTPAAAGVNFFWILDLELYIILQLLLLLLQLELLLLPELLLSV